MAPNLPKPSPEVAARMKAARKRILDRRDRYAAESPLKNETTKNDLALICAGLFEHYWIVLMRSTSGEGKAEETRTLPAIASNYARMMRELGATAEKMTPEEEEL